MKIKIIIIIIWCIICFSGGFWAGLVRERNERKDIIQWLKKVMPDYKFWYQHDKLK